MLQFRVYRKTENFDFLGGPTPFSQLLTGAIADVPQTTFPEILVKIGWKIKISVFWGLCNPFFRNFHQRVEEHPIAYPCTRIDKIRQGNSQVTTFYSIQSYHAGFKLLY
jgi:hypothetical protein